jgi:hypothetical protein
MPFTTEAQMVRHIDVLEGLISFGPGRTQLELARALHGEEGYQQQVNQECSLLESMGKVEKRGEGGAGNPFRYYPK